MIINNKCHKKIIKFFNITGASKGFGLELTNQLLERGFNVAANSRNKQQLSNSVNNKFITNDNFLALQVDLTSDESVKNSINETISKFTRIDVIINNTGYSQCDKEIRDNFECNVFDVISVIRNALHIYVNKFFVNGPRIINISSMAGFIGSFPGFKFGIHASTVLPGYFRTSFLGKGSQGYPVKGCKVIIDHALSENSTTHLLLGPDSMKHAQSKIESIQNDIKLNYDESSKTDFTN
ncbi:hypothetical protein ACTFIZ_011758 [Dictyostelium cf. discoideum]